MSPGQTFEITSVRTDGFAGELDLVVNYRAKDVSDPVAARTEILALMKALLAEHPELRQAFPEYGIPSYQIHQCGVVQVLDR